MNKEHRIKTNDLNQWQEKLEQKRKHVSCGDEENVLVNPGRVSCFVLSKQRKAFNLLFFFQIKQACNNIFQKLCKWKKTNLPVKEDDDKKLSFIENSINELQKAVQLAYKLSYKDNISCKGNSSFITEKRMV